MMHFPSKVIEVSLKTTSKATNINIECRSRRHKRPAQTIKGREKMRHLCTPLYRKGTLHSCRQLARHKNEIQNTTGIEDT